MSVDGDDFVDDDEIRWSGSDGIVGAFVGSIITLVGLTIAEFVGLVTLGFQSASSAFWGFLATVVSTPLESGAQAISGVWRAGADGLAMFGPFAFPVAVLISAASILLLIWGAFWAARRFAS